MNPVYLGVDVAGAKNTWVTALSSGQDGLVVVDVPHLASLQEIVRYCEEYDVVAATIDAQLTIALSEENGFRASDMDLRDMIAQRRGSRNWLRRRRASWPCRCAAVCWPTTSRPP